MSNELGRVYRFDPQIYPRKIWVAVGGDIGTLRASFCQNDGKQLEIENMYKYSAITIVVTEKETRLSGELIWFPKKSDMRVFTIAHEAVHAAIDIFDDCDCRIDAENQEPFAYLVGWIAKCINEVKRGKYEKSPK